MAIKISVSREEMLSGKPVPPGWYLCTIKDVFQKPATTDGSTNTVVKYRVKEGQYIDTPLQSIFSEKAPGTIVGFIEVLSGQEFKPDFEYDIESAIGKDIRCKVINEEYKGRLLNRVDGFKAA